MRILRENVSNNSPKVHKRKEFDQCKSAWLSCASHHDISVYDAHEIYDLLFQQYCIWLRYSWIRTKLETKRHPSHFVSGPVYVREGADKSLARPGRKQNSANKLGIYSTHSPRSSIHFLALAITFTSHSKKKSDRCPSNQELTAAMTSASDEKWRPCNCFFSPGNMW